VPRSLRRLSHAVAERRPRRRPQPDRPARGWWLALVGAVSLAALIWLVFGTSVLGLRTVEITGAPIAGAVRVREAAGIADGTPLARIDTGAVAARIRQLPSVASVDVHRSWPSTLVIAVTERTPVAVVRDGDAYQVLDADAVVFNTVAQPPAGVLLVRVTTPASGDPTADAKAAEGALRAAVRVVVALPADLRSKVSEIQAKYASNVRLILGDGRTILWGDAERSDAKARVALVLLDRASHQLDVSDPGMAAVS
jgi:cell division protein FtsQ